MNSLHVLFGSIYDFVEQRCGTLAAWFLGLALFGCLAIGTALLIF